MCQTATELCRAVGAFASTFEVELVVPGDLPGLLRDFGSAERVLAAMSSMTAARMASLTSARRAAEELARASGTSMTEARRSVDAGKVMAERPELGAAARAGELSRQQASLVAGAARDNPGATGEVLEAARTSSLSELAEAAGRARAAACDLVARTAAVRARRGLREWTDQGGTWHLHAEGPPEDGARLMAALRPFADRAFQAARKEGRHERAEAYAFDALAAIATGGGGARASYDVMVRVDLPALLRGYATEGETCELPGFGPVAPQAVYDMIDSGDAFLKAVVTKGKDVTGVAHLGRRPTAHQRSALDFLFPTCAAEGCGVRAGFLQTDHRVDWAESHITMFDLLDRLCPHHHRMKTNQGWALAGGRGKRPFVAPDDPRHPRSAGPPVRTRPAPSNGPRTAPSNGPRTAPSNGPRTAPSTAPSTAPGTTAPGPVAASGDAAVRGPSPPGPAAPRAHTSPQALPPPEATAPRPAPRQCDSRSTTTSRPEDPGPSQPGLTGIAAA